MHVKVKHKPSDVQTLKAHDDLFKKGYWTKGSIYDYYC